MGKECGGARRLRAAGLISEYNCTSETCRAGTHFAGTWDMCSAFVRRSRPAAWAALFQVAGLLAAHILRLPLWVPASLCLGLLAAAAGWRRCRGVALLAALLFAATLRHEVSTELFPRTHIRRASEFGQKVRLAGRVWRTPERSAERTRLVIEVHSLGVEAYQRAASGKVLITFRGLSTRADAGDYMVVRGRLQRPEPARNPGAFDYRSYLALQGIHATLSIHERAQIDSLKRLPGPWIHEFLVRPVREAVRRVICRHLSGDSAALLQGILLGDKHGIPSAVTEQFRATGLAHALVISGLHTGLLAVFFYVLFSLARCSARLASACTIAALTGFAVITGLQPPVVRAVVMASTVLGGRVLARNCDVYNSLGLAAVLILSVWPQSLFGLSFQLSFAATLAIVGLHRRLMVLVPAGWRRNHARVTRLVIAPLMVSVAAQLGTGPLIAWYFQHLPVLAPVANLIVVPLLAATVSLGLVAVMAGLLWAPAALPFLACNGLVLAAILTFVRGMSAICWTSISVPRPTLAFLVWCGVMAGLMGRSVGSVMARKFLVVLLLAGANIAVWHQVVVRRGLDVVFLDVGQGDAAFLRFPNGRTMLVDGGNCTPSFDYGRQVLLPYLRRCGVKRLDAVVATHPHSDHVGGLVSVLEELEVGWYLDNGQHSDSRAVRRLRELICEHGIEYCALTAGDSLAGLGEAGVVVLHPRPVFICATGRAPANMNNGSLVLRVTCGSTALLFTGDVERESDPYLLPWEERLCADVIKVPHHGSSTSSSPRFVEAVSPRLAVVSVGARNRFGHPDTAVLERYRRLPARLLRTDQHGAVSLRVLRAEMRVDTVLNGLQ